METVAVFDVAIIGGGPAGSTAARLLAQWGHSVAILNAPTSHGHSLAAADAMRLPQVRGDVSFENGMHLINLSLGMNNPAHEQLLRAAVDRVRARQIILVAAYEDAGVRWLPGVLPVALDWNCPRDEYRTEALPDGPCTARLVIQGRSRVCRKSEISRASALPWRM